uniref:Uncharacterized protein n=2 Tax=Zea mays TaxID=4577 RepID=A0A804PKH7_MAIZE
MAADQPSALPILLLARVPCSSAPWMQPLLTMDALPSSSDGARVPDTQDSPRPSASAFPSAPFTIGHGPLGTLRAWHFSDPSSRSRGASPCHLPPMDAQKNPPCRRPFFSLTRCPSRNSSRVFFLPLLSTACSKQGAELHLPLMAGHSRGSPRLSSQAQPSPMARCSRCLNNTSSTLVECLMFLRSPNIIVVHPGEKPRVCVEEASRSTLVDVRSYAQIGITVVLANAVWVCLWIAFAIGEQKVM